MISSRLIDRLRLLDLGDDGDATPLLRHDDVHALHIRGVAHERERDEVGADAQPPAEVGLVLLGQGRDVDGDTREVDALVVRRPGRPTMTSVVTTVPSVSRTLTRTLPSSMSRKSPGLTSCGEALEGRADDLLGAEDVLGR